MENNHQPRPFMEYQSRVCGYETAHGKYRGVIGCSYRDGSMTETEYFTFKNGTLRDTVEEAMRDAADLFYKLETTSPATVVLCGQLYSLPTKEEFERATKWLRENEHVPPHFSREFPGARLVTTSPLGSSTARGY